MIRIDTIEMVHGFCDMCGEDAVPPYVTPMTYYPRMEIPCTVVTCSSCGFMYTHPRASAGLHNSAHSPSFAYGQSHLDSPSRTLSICMVARPDPLP